MDHSWNDAELYILPMKSPMEKDQGKQVKTHLLYFPTLSENLDMWIQVHSLQNPQNVRQNWLQAC